MGSETARKLFGKRAFTNGESQGGLMGIKRSCRQNGQEGRLPDTNRRCCNARLFSTVIPGGFTLVKRCIRGHLGGEVPASGRVRKNQLTTRWVRKKMVSENRVLATFLFTAELQRTNRPR